MDNGDLSEKEVDMSSSISEKFFEMRNKPYEIQASKKNKRSILEKIPEWDNAIGASDEVIGFTFIVPCDKDIMINFY